MGGPWEKFQPAPSAVPADGPWNKFKTPEPEQPQEEPGLLSKSLGIAGRVLDYPGGLIRTAGAGLANIPYSIATGKSITQEGDLTNALKGKAPTSAEFMERAGVPEGPHANLMPEFTVGGHTFGKGDTSLRDAEGLLMDIGTDPLTALAKGVKPISNTIEGAGKSIYRSGLKKVDEKLLEKGVTPIADTLIEHGAPIGTTKRLAAKAGEIGDELGTQRKALYEKANALGVKVDMSAVTKNTEEMIAKMKADPGLAPMAEKFEDLVNRYKAEGFTDLATASDWKTNLYNALPESAYDSFGKVKGPAQKIQKQLASDFRKAIIAGAESGEKGLGSQIDKINEGLGSVISSKRPMAMQIRRANTPNMVSVVDGMIGGFGIHSPEAAAGILAAKKAAELSKTTIARTALGKGLINASKVPLMDAAAYRGLINESKK